MEHMSGSNSSIGREREKNEPFFQEREGESLASMVGLRVHGVAQFGAKGKPLHFLKAWLKRCRLWVCVCVCA